MKENEISGSDIRAQTRLIKGSEKKDNSEILVFGVLGSAENYHFIVKIGSDLEVFNRVQFAP